jgi:hypothetical protein
MTSVVPPTDLLSLPIVWENVSVGRWRASVQDSECLLKLNNFPDEPLFTVTVGDLSVDVGCSADVDHQIVRTAAACVVHHVRHAIAALAKTMNINTTIFLCSTILTACVPYVTTYPKLQAPNATYLHFGCQAELDAKSTAYYPFHGIYISMDMRDSRFGLHVPFGTVVELNGKTIKIDGLRGTTPYQATFNLRAASHKSVGLGYAPAQFMEAIDHYTTPDNFGPLEGGGNGTYLLWYLYLFQDPQDPQRILFIPKGLTEGTIEIPAITINGQHYDPQVLTFKRETFTGLAAVNC